MRELVHEALAGAREMVDQVVGDLRAEGKLTDDEVLTRYESQHRGRPWAILDFAQQQAPAGGDALSEALKYESALEKLLKQKSSGGA